MGNYSIRYRQVNIKSVESILSTEQIKHETVVPFIAYKLHIKNQWFSWCYICRSRRSLRRIYIMEMASTYFPHSPLIQCVYFWAVELLPIRLFITFVSCTPFWAIHSLLSFFFFFALFLTCKNDRNVCLFSFYYSSVPCFISHEKKKLEFAFDFRSTYVDVSQPFAFEMKILLL